MAHCQTLCVSAINSSFPGCLLADAVNSSPFSHSLTLPSWITACAGAHVSRGRAQLQKGSPLGAQASCLHCRGSPGQSSPVTCFPFLSLYLFGRKTHWPCSKHSVYADGGAGERERGVSENVVICHHVYGLGNQNKLF